MSCSIEYVFCVTSPLGIKTNHKVLNCPRLYLLLRFAPLPFFLSRSSGGKTWAVCPTVTSHKLLELPEVKIQPDNKLYVSAGISEMVAYKNALERAQANRAVQMLFSLNEQNFKNSAIFPSNSHFLFSKSSTTLEK